MNNPLPLNKMAMIFGRHKRMISSLVLCVIASFSLCLCAAADTDSWEVVVRIIPVNVSVKDVFDAVDSYIIRQTHEPYFRRDDGENYTSRIVKKWSRDLDYTNYTFCPEPGLGFNSDNALTAESFYSHLTETTRLYRSSFTAAEDGACTHIAFSAPARGYLDFLTRYENSPTMKTAPNIEAGLGPFYVEKLTVDAAVLKRKKQVRDGYNTIVVRKLAGPNDPKLNSRDISDFNMLPSPPVWVTKEYREFSNLDPRSIVLVINNKSLRLRKALYRCLDIDKFRDAFTLTFKDYQNIRSILPLGISGAAAGLPEKACRKEDYFPGEEVVLISQKADNRSELEKFSRYFYAKTGIKIVVKNEAPQDITTMLKKASERHPYNLIVFVLNSSHSDYEDYFRYFIPGKDAAIDWGGEGLGELYQRLVKEDFPERKTIIAKELAQEISERALALPLFQYSRKVYYPKHIKNLNVGRGFIEFPEIADFRR